jgi:DNA-binding transcriptional MerR regulator
MQTVEGFSSGQASKLARLPVAKLDQWERTGFLRASIPAKSRGFSRLYTFRDVIALRVAGELRAAGVSVQMLRRITAYLRARDGLTATDALASTNLVMNGDNVYEVMGDVVINVPSGQRMIVNVIPLHAVVREVQRTVRALRAAA